MLIVSLIVYGWNRLKTPLILTRNIIQVPLSRTLPITFVIVMSPLCLLVIYLILKKKVWLTGAAKHSLERPAIKNDSTGLTFLNLTVADFQARKETPSTIPEPC